MITYKLDQLEARLQILIEGRIARLLPAQVSKDDLGRKMVTAMQAGIQQQGDGTLLAPDVFHIRTHPQQATHTPELDLLLRESADLIQREGDQVGLCFAQPPTIKFVSDAAIPAGEVDVLAQVSQSDLGETYAIELEVDNEVENIPSNAFLIVNGSDVFPLEQTVINIGRKTDNHLVIDDPRVSRHHAQLRAVRGRYIIFDLDSTGSTFVNGRRVVQSVLKSQDVISLAEIPLVYAQDGLDATQDTQKLPTRPASQDSERSKGDII
ncbi:MAG: FHA domain-containing protein [Chloroflexota bacterium]|nr:FHA domain-containing protein [Chloroflexota bacterium]